MDYLDIPRFHFTSFGAGKDRGTGFADVGSLSLTGDHHTFFKLAFLFVVDYSRLSSFLSVSAWRIALGNRSILYELNMFIWQLPSPE